MTWRRKCFASWWSWYLESLLRMIFMN